MKQPGVRNVRGEGRAWRGWVSVCLIAGGIGANAESGLLASRSPGGSGAGYPVDPGRVFAGSDRARSDGPETVSADVFSEFRAWLENYRLAATGSGKAALTRAGEVIAARRREALFQLISADPERALRMAVPYQERAQLPGSVLALLENRISARGDLRVIAATPRAGRDPYAAPVKRRAVIGPEVYRAFVYGRRAGLTTQENVPLHGIAVGDVMAVDESPTRELEPGEPIPRAARGAGARVRCATCGRGADGRWMLDVGGEIVAFCSPGHKAAYQQNAEAAEKGIGPKGHAGLMGMTNAPSWTQGPKTVLLIRANFPDDTAEPITQAGGAALMDGVNAFFVENSYGQTRMTSTVTPLVTLPQPKTYYATNTGGDDALLNDARAAAKAIGFDTAGFDLDAVIYAAIFNFGGQGLVGGKGTWLQDTNVGTAVHEFGHNYGLQHANYWNATGDTVIGPGGNEEYGNIFDTMGDSSVLGQFGAYNKTTLSWIATNQVSPITASGIYRLYPFDVASLTDGVACALKITKDAERDYWIELRQKMTNNVWLQNGVLLTWSPWSQSASGTQLLDTTPGSPAGKNDAAVVLGRTFSDFDAGIHITPVAKSTSPTWIDVAVNLGTFPGNRPPAVTLSADTTSTTAGAPVALTATATDPDGDTVAYSWDFGDQTVAPNSPAVTHSWSQDGEYVVRCVATDMKGGISSTNLMVTIGTPSTFRIAGRVIVGGTPVEGVRVFVSNDTVAYTDSSGNYTLTALPAGSYVVTAVKPGYTLPPAGFANPVTVGPNASDINFGAVVSTYTLSGKVTDNGSPVADVVVTDGTRTNVTSSAGVFTLTGVPAGDYTLTATKAGFAFVPSTGNWTNTLHVEAIGRTNLDFIRVLYPVTGSISGLTGSATNQAVAVTIGDNLHEVSAPYNPADGLWEYTLAVPAGQWNLQAALAGYNIATVNFTNPIAVAGGGLSNLNFAAVVTNTTVTDLPPTLILTAPVDGQRFVAPSDLLLNAAADDADGTVSQVSFYQGTVLLGTLTSPPYALTWTNVPAGAYVLTAVAIDNAGLAVTSAPVNINLTSTPDNDNFANATPITGAATNLAGANGSATKEPGEPNHANNPGGKSVWWSWLAPSSGDAAISTAGSAFDTLLAVYTGDSVSNLTAVASSATASGSGSGAQVIFKAVTGTNYYIAVDGVGVTNSDGYQVASGAIALSLTLTVPTNTVTAPTLMPVALGASSGFQLKLVGQAGAYDLEASVNLVDWVPVGRVTNTALEILFTDPATVGLAHRFYRARSSP